MTIIMIACILGLVLDMVIGDPPKWPHPVRWIGSLIKSQVDLWNRGRFRKFKGVMLFIAVVGTTLFVVVTILGISYSLNFWIGFTVETLLIAVGLAQKSLKQAAMSVYNPLVKGDLAEARIKLSWIVGRDTAHLKEDEITRGVVETVSENTSDGVTAPLFWAFLLGAPGIWVYKAVNTLDSMIGYKNEQYGDIGMFSARMDDVLNFIPSRLTGLCIVLFTHNETKRTLGQRLKLWRKDAKKHPSPNSGWLEAATAYQLGIQLGGENVYKGVVSHRAQMGVKDTKLSAVHIIKTVTQMRLAVLVFTLLMLILGGLWNALT